MTPCALTPQRTTAMPTKARLAAARPLRRAPPQQTCRCSSSSSSSSASPKNKLAPGESNESASSWIAKWKARQANESTESPEEVEARWQEKRKQLREQFTGDSFTYIYCHGFRSSPESLKAAAISRLFAARGIDIDVLDLRGPQSPSHAGTSVAHMVGVIHDAVCSSSQPVRLIGSSLGGYVASLYAARYPERIERLVLLCPAFEPGNVLSAAAGGADAMDAWRSTGSHDFGDGDAVNAKPLLDELNDEGEFPPYPFVRCPALVVHGVEDDVVPLETSLSFARQASVNMRPLGMSGDVVEERRLMEVNDTHDLSQSMEYILERLCKYFDLETTGEMAMRQGMGPSLEGDAYGTRESFARGHGFNYEVLESFEEWDEAVQRNVRGDDNKPK